jgi:hypothetical protein
VLLKVVVAVVDPEERFAKRGARAHLPQGVSRPRHQCRHTTHDDHIYLYPDASSPLLRSILGGVAIPSSPRWLRTAYFLGRPGPQACKETQRQIKDGTTGAHTHDLLGLVAALGYQGLTMSDAGGPKA